MTKFGKLFRITPIIISLLLVFNLIPSVAFAESTAIEKCDTDLLYCSDRDILNEITCTTDAAGSFKADYEYTLVNTTTGDEVEIRVDVTLFNQEVTVSTELVGVGEYISLSNGQILIDGNLTGEVLLGGKIYSLLAVFQKIEGENTEYIGITFDSAEMETPLFVNLGQAVVSREMAEQLMGSEPQSEVTTMPASVAPDEADFQYVGGAYSSDHLQMLSVNKDLNGENIYAFEVKTFTNSVPEVAYHLYTYVSKVNIKVSSNNVYGKVSGFHLLPEELTAELTNKTSVSVDYESLVGLLADLLGWGDLYALITSISITAYKNSGTLTAEYAADNSFRSITVEPKTSSLYELYTVNFDSIPLMFALIFESVASSDLGTRQFPFTATSNVTYRIAHGASSISYNNVAAAPASLQFYITM